MSLNLANIVILLVPQAGLSNLYNDKIGLTWFSAPEPGDVFTTCMATNPYVVWTESPIKADLSFETLEYPNSPSALLWRESRVGLVMVGVLFYFVTAWCFFAL